MSELISQRIRALSPEIDPLRMGMGRSEEELSKPQVMIESTFGDSHPGLARDPVRRHRDPRHGHAL